MTTAQYDTMSRELWQDIGAIAGNENLMRRLARYAKKLVKEQNVAHSESRGSKLTMQSQSNVTESNDPTLMTKEKYFAMLDEAEQQLKRGEGMTMLPDEDLTAFLRRNGYEI